MGDRGREGAEATPLDAFLAGLAEIGAVPRGGLAALRARAESGPSPSDPTPLARRLIGGGAVTEFQARYLVHGRASDLLVGRYVIVDRIGRGSMGRVYRARQPILGRDVALKMIDARQVRDDRVVARFRREMRMAGRLDHPNVVRAYDADLSGDQLFIAMELVRGASLEDHLRRRGALPPAEVARCAAQAASGLAHAHARGVIHRDVKPSNILVDERGTVRVLDFGLGVLAEREDPDGFATEAAYVVGTANFLSPEQACGRPLDGRSDLYSLGCTMYYLLTGTLPFQGGSSMERIAARLVGKAAPIDELRPGLPRELVEAVERLMARRPEDRFRDAAEATAELRRLARIGAAATGGVSGRQAPPLVSTVAAGKREPRMRRILRGFLSAGARGRRLPAAAARASA
jgi:serine/threonine protein kinase